MGCVWSNQRNSVDRSLVQTDSESSSDMESAQEYTLSQTQIIHKDRTDEKATSSFESLSSSEESDESTEPHKSELKRSKSNHVTEASPMYEFAFESKANYPTFKPPKPKLGPVERFKATQEGNFHREKYNSTSSLYIKESISKPNIHELLRCMSVALLYHIQNGEEAREKRYVEIFNEEKHPISKHYNGYNRVPDVSHICRFLTTIFDVERLDPECAIMALAYIERVRELSDLTLDSTNWRRVMLAAVILASKVWEDQSVYNVDFTPVFDNLSVPDLNKLEREFLTLLQYNVTLNRSSYAKYYFELQKFSKVDPSSFPLQPLTQQNAARLEDHSHLTQIRLTSQMRDLKRAASTDHIISRKVHSIAVLN